MCQNGADGLPLGPGWFERQVTLDGGLEGGLPDRGVQGRREAHETSIHAGEAPTRIISVMEAEQTKVGGTEVGANA